MRKVTFILGACCALAFSVHLGAGQWTTTLVDGAGSTGWSPSIAIDGNDHPGIAYHSHSMAVPRYAYYDGSTWQLTTVPTSYGYHPGLAFDSNNHPGISCFGNDGFSSGLVYAHYDGSAWHTEIAEMGDHTGDLSSLALDKDGRPCISHVRTDTGDLRYAHYDGSSWQTSTVDSNIGLAQARIAVDSGGSPRIAYCHAKTGSYNVWCATYSGTSWSSSLVGPGAYVGFALDADNFPHISYSGLGPGGPGALRYTSFDGSQWHDELVETCAGVWSTSLCLDALGQPHIAYWAETGSPLTYGVRYASRVGGVWQFDSVVTLDTTSAWLSMALDSSGSPYIAYCDQSNPRLYVATPVPEPGTLLLALSGLIGLGAFLRPWKRPG